MCRLEIRVPAAAPLVGMKTHLSALFEQVFGFFEATEFDSRLSVYHSRGDCPALLNGVSSWRFPSSQDFICGLVSRRGRLRTRTLKSARDTLKSVPVRSHFLFI